MVYGVLKFINFAHGDVYMIGAYVGMFVVAVMIGLPPAFQGILGLIICMFVCALLGAFIERLAYRPLRNALSGKDAAPWSLFIGLYCGLILGPVLDYKTPLNATSSFLIVTGITTIIVFKPCQIAFAKIGQKLKPSRSRLTALITAIGLSLLLENQGQATFGASPQAYQIKDIGKSFNVHIGHNILTISAGRLYLLGASILLTTLLVYIVRYTRLGKAIRAVSYDPDAAALMGIPTDKIIAFTFILGASLAGAGGFLNHGLTQLSFDANIGISLGLKAFIAAVLGGIGSIEGAVLGGLLMGLVESFTGGSSLSEFRDAISFIILIAVLIFKPAGLLGKAVVEKV